MTMRTLSLTKDGARYVFSYPPGCESDILGEILRLANDARSEVDWLDAATLSSQVVRAASGDRSGTVRPFQDAPS